MKPRYGFFLLIALLAGNTWASEAGTALKADELKAEPYRDARVLGHLRGGEQLDILRQQGGWYQVKTGKGSGWVRMLSVRRGAARKGGDLSGLAGLASGRAGTGKVVATTGVRGLSEAELKSARFNEVEIRQLEANTASRDEARKFANQAQLKSIRLDYLPNPEGATQ